MRTILRFTLAAIIAALTMSCSRSLTDMGYPSGRDFQYTAQSARLGFGRDYFSPTLGGTSISPFYSPSTKEYDVYGFVADHDLQHLYESRIAMRLVILRELYSQLSTQTFNAKKLAQEYNALLSPHVRQSSNSLSATDSANPLGIWQMLKPYPGLDAPTAKYQITYKGNDWFSVKPEGDDAEVRLRIVLAGKQLQPVLAEVENPSFGVATGVGTDQNLGKGYSVKRDWNFTVKGRYRRSDNYNKYLASVVFDQCTADHAHRNYVTEADILAFADRLVEDRKALLQDMYAALTAEPFANNQFAKKFSSVISVPVRKAMKSAVAATGHTHSAGEWETLEPKDKANYRITYDEQNWFKVVGDSEDKPDLYVQVAYYGRKLYPLITGIYNKAYGLFVQQDFGADKSNPRNHW